MCDHPSNQPGKAPEPFCLPCADEIKKQHLQLLVVIADRAKNKQITDILQEKHIHFHFVVLAQGTASSEVMDLLGLGSIDKTVSLCITPRQLTPVLMNALENGLHLYRAGKGIAFAIPLSGASSPLLQLLEEDIRDKWRLDFDKEEEPMHTASTHTLIIAVINQGCSEDLMHAAKAAGATGGTVLHARRISTDHTVKFFGISIQEEKEVVAILATREMKKEIMNAISHTCGMKTEAGGVFLSLPVDSIAGLGEWDEESATE